MAFSAPLASTIEGLGINGGTSSAIDTTGADLLIIAVGTYDVTPMILGLISDSKGNTWSALTHFEVAADVRVVIFYCIPTSVGASHTVTLPRNGSYTSCAFVAFSGAKQATPADQEAGSSATATSLTPGSVTPVEDNELVISAIAMDAADAPTIDSGFTRIGYVNFSGGNYFGVAIGYKIQTGAAAVSPTWSWSGSHPVAGVNETFKAAAGGAVAKIGAMTHQHRIGRR